MKTQNESSAKTTDKETKTQGKREKAWQTHKIN